MQVIKLGNLVFLNLDPHGVFFFIFGCLNLKFWKWSRKRLWCNPLGQLQAPPPGRSAGCEASVDIVELQHHMMWLEKATFFFYTEITGFGIRIWSITSEKVQKSRKTSHFPLTGTSCRCGPHSAEILVFLDPGKLMVFCFMQEHLRASLMSKLHPVTVPFLTNHRLRMWRPLNI